MNGPSFWRWLLVATFLSACTAEAGKSYGDELPERVDFNFHIKPILSDRCFACHGPDEAAREADLRLDQKESAFAALAGETEGPRRFALVPGDPEASQVYHRIYSQDPEQVMPPPESHLSLSEKEKQLITRWIEQGAEWKEHWSFLPIPAPKPPPSPFADWETNEIDVYVGSRLAREGLRPTPSASREQWLRRVSFDLTGLPPSLADMDAFLADSGEQAFERVVDRLLASPHYGEHMAVDWLDLARYADSHGYQDDGMRNMWPWRDWVIRSFNQNIPFDQFVIWQLAGDLLPNPTDEQLLATAFNRNHLQTQEGGVISEEYRIEYVADRTQTLGKAFLGLTLECARCHDHKYDPISQKAYYQLFGFFNQVNETGQIPYSGEASPTLVLHDDTVKAQLASLQRQARALENVLHGQDSGFVYRYKTWLAAVEETPQMIKLPPQDPIGDFPLDQGQDGKYLNRANPAYALYLAGDRDLPPITRAGPWGQAQELTGESYLTVKPNSWSFSGDWQDQFAFFDRQDPFSISLRFQLLQDSIEGPLFARTGGLFNGNRGFDCYLQADGRLAMSLNHCFPDNGIQVISREAVSAHSWHHLVVRYDGSSRAAGLDLYLDGEALNLEVRVDQLRQSMLRFAGDYPFWGSPGYFSIGKRGNEESLDHTLVDACQVYARALSELEIQALAGQDAPVSDLLASQARSPSVRELLRHHYAGVVDPVYAHKRQALRKIRSEENDLVSQQPQVMIMRERREPRPTFVLDRGQYDQALPGAVEPQPPSTILPFPDHYPRNRLGLALWLTRPKNPLLARATVNRYWQRYFGRGIVNTSDDLGSQGDLPSHPGLLDALAYRFITSGWDVKALQKHIVLSATYRQSSQASPELLALDPQNELLARGPSHRLSAEQSRDHVLAASGLLVPTIGGPSVKPYQPPGLWKQLATRNVTEYVQQHGDSLYRRSMYTFWKRSSPPPAMITFDATERYFCEVKRQHTSTPLQALVLMNDPQFLEAARMLAERMMRSASTHADRLRVGFRLLTSRRPSAYECQVLDQLWQAEFARFSVDPASALALLTVGEKAWDQQLPPAELAAYAITASTLMNFDESMTKR